MRFPREVGEWEADLPDDEARTTIKFVSPRAEAWVAPGSLEFLDRRLTGLVNRDTFEMSQAPAPTDDHQEWMDRAVEFLEQTPPDAVDHPRWIEGADDVPEGWELGRFEFSTRKTWIGWDRQDLPDGWERQRILIHGRRNGLAWDVWLITETVDAMSERKAKNPITLPTDASPEVALSRGRTLAEQINAGEYDGAGALHVRGSVAGTRRAMTREMSAKASEINASSELIAAGAWEATRDREGLDPFDVMDRYLAQTDAEQFETWAERERIEEMGSPETRKALAERMMEVIEGDDTRLTTQDTPVMTRYFRQHHAGHDVGRDLALAFETPEEFLRSSLDRKLEVAGVPEKDREILTNRYPSIRHLQEDARGVRRNQEISPQSREMVKNAFLPPASRDEGSRNLYPWPTGEDPGQDAEIGVFEDTDADAEKTDPNALLDSDDRAFLRQQRSSIEAAMKAASMGTASARGLDEGDWLENFYIALGDATRDRFERIEETVQEHEGSVRRTLEDFYGGEL